MLGSVQVARQKFVRQLGDVVPGLGGESAMMDRASGFHNSSKKVARKNAPGVDEYIDRLELKIVAALTNLCI